MSWCRFPPLPVLIALVGAIGTPPAEAQDPSRVQSTCVDCHVEAGVDKNQALAHADSMTCLTCHHIGFTNEPELSASRRIEICRDCHEDLAVPHWSGPPAEDETALHTDAPDCGSCHSVHGDPEIGEAGALISPRCSTCHVERHALHSDASGDAPSCVACHTEHVRGPVGQRASASDRCEVCHEQAHPSHAGVDNGRLDCAACHGIDTDPPIPADADRLSATCVRCHEEVHPTHSGIEDQGPGCVACHAFESDPVTSEAGAAISPRCGVCHEDELAAFRAGGHADALADLGTNGDLPTCISCHASHEDPGEDRARLRLAATAECLECHSAARLIEKYDLPEDATASYLDDFHGVTVAFLRSEVSQTHPANVMICSDCHSPHEVGWQEGAVVADVCLSCHEDGDEKLAGAWLGHARVGPPSEFAIWAVRLFYYVMIPFVLVGLSLNIAFSLVNERRKGARVLRTEGVQRIRARLSGRRLEAQPTVLRFSLVERLEHLGAMITFPLLVITGLPQTNPTGALSRSVTALFGGISDTRLVHRVTGFVFVSLLVVHLVRGIAATVRARRLPDIGPRKQDFIDVLATARHFLWRTPRPKVGKFDASEKFEYWGLFFGGLIMSVTGLALVFPELVTQFVPGIVVAAMRTVHGLEATFAVLVVVLWHTYGVILRPEIFPLDTSMFTGRISVDRLREEHALQHDELFPDEQISSSGATLDPR